MNGLRRPHYSCAVVELVMVGMIVFLKVENDAVINSCSSATTGILGPTINRAIVKAAIPYRGALAK
jgi:hypothetical protein